MTVSYEDRVATLDEHRALAAAVGWDDHFPWEVMAASLDRSVHGVVALVDGEVVGMGRIVGDGVHYFYLQDVIVRPEQGESGLGSTIVARLLDWIGETATAEAFVGLFASPEAVGLYEEFRFVTTDMTGMHRFVQPE